MNNLLNKPITELAKYLTSLIKDEYKNNETVTRHSCVRWSKREIDYAI